MKFTYNIDEVVRALDYYDIKGLLLMMDKNIFDEKEPSLTEMEGLFKKMLPECDPFLHKHIESLMLSCARVNSLGY